MEFFNSNSLVSKIVITLHMENYNLLDVKFAREMATMVYSSSVLLNSFGPSIITSNRKFR